MADEEQEKLAAEWAAALSDQGDDAGGDADPGEDLASEWAAALEEQDAGEGGESSDQALADEWAAALADQEAEGEQTSSDKELADQWAAALEDQDEGGAGPGDEGLANEWAAALANQEEDDLKREKEQEYLRTQTRDADFRDMTQEAKSPRPDMSKRDLDFILDIPLEVTAELGRTKLLINDLLQLGQGSIVELNKLAGEPLEIYVNGKLVARGEAVVINEKFGIRLTDIISPIERVKQLA
ncbi:MAG: flagellar motor switch protein FliN [Desulfovibrionales bacterium]|jgi:flagellar motor switch protein FliN/FliY|nr:flagellar motor switch protein FliN [Desulfovibrionales bacterium]